MGLFLFIDGPALVFGWVNFPILWPHIPVQMKLKCPPPPGFQKISTHPLWTTLNWVPKNFRISKKTIAVYAGFQILLIQILGKFQNFARFRIPVKIHKILWNRGIPVRLTEHFLQDFQCRPWCVCVCGYFLEYSGIPHLRK